MKKLIQIFATISIICSAQLAHAGNNKLIRPTDPAPHDSSSVRANFKSRPVGGEVALTITVLDINNHPISNAQVSAPCTGQAAKFTNVHGVAQFKLGSSCPCSDDDLTVSTLQGCYQQMKVSCGPYTVKCNP